MVDQGGGTATPSDLVARAPAIETHKLTKRYGSRKVVDALDIRVPEGVVAGFIGPNGAGKTTTLRMLLGLIKPTSGEGTIFGVSLASPTRYLTNVGAMVEGPGFSPGLSGERNLAVVARLAGVEDPPIPRLLDRVGLSRRGGDTYRTYSLGMKQRLGIAAALIGQPRLLILDEPANGLDPGGIREMRALLRAFRDDGQTVLVSSHQLNEVQQVCDWLIMIDHGRLVHQGPTAQLVSGSGALALRAEFPSDTSTLHDILKARGLPATRDDDSVHIRMRDLVGDAALDGDADARRRAVAAVSRAIADQGITLVELRVIDAALEDQYEQMMTRSAR